MADPPLIHIVDDNDGLRESLVSVLFDGPWQICAHESAEHFLSRHDPRCWGCVLLDLELPGLSGLELLEQHGTRLLQPTILMAGELSIPLTVKAMKAGAFDAFEKPVCCDLVEQRIHEALAWDRATRQHRLAEAHWRDRFAVLSAAERDLLRRMLQGTPNKMIALQLNCSLRTVHSRRQQLFDKLGISTRAELAHIASASWYADGPHTVAAIGQRHA